MSKLHPESLEEQNTIRVTEGVKEFIKELSSDIEDAKGQVGIWEQRQKEYYRKRYGIRKRRNFPWPGYPNYVLPLIDSDIQKAKPAYVNAAFGVAPIVTYEPFGPEDVEPARLRESLLDFRVKHKMNFFEPYCIGVDKMLQVGFTVFKVLWKFKSRKYTEFLDIGSLPPNMQDALYHKITTDPMLKKILQEHFDIDMEFEENQTEIERIVAEFRAGETEFTLTLFEKESNEAELVVCDPEEDLTVPADTTNISDARWIDYKFFSTINNIKIGMRDGKYKEYSLEDIATWGGKEPHKNDQERQYREGTTQDSVSDEVVLLHETCVLYDIDGDGILEKCIATWPDSDSTAVLRFIELPYDHGMWPYVQVERELVDSGFFSARGIPALDDDFQTGISASFNNDLANQLIVNTPYVKYLKGGVPNVRNRRFVPGEAVEVKDMNAYNVEQSVNASQGTFMVTQQQLKAWAQERIGNQSHGLSAINNTPGQGQQGKRTAREIEEVSFITSLSQSLDIMVFQYQMKWVYYQIDALYNQFGQEEEYIMTGTEPKRVSRRETQGRFNMTPTGKLENSNPVVRAQKAVMLYQAFKDDPDIRQDELKKFVISDNYDPKTAKRLMLSPEEKHQMQAQQFQMSEMMRQKLVKDAASTQQVGNAIELQKEMGIAAIHGRRYAKDPVKEPKKEKGTSGGNGRKR